MSIFCMCRLFMDTRLAVASSILKSNDFPLCAYHMFPYVLVNRCRAAMAVNWVTMNIFGLSLRVVSACSRLLLGTFFVCLSSYLMFWLMMFAI